jgi:hypothetical protein
MKRIAAFCLSLLLASASWGQLAQTGGGKATAGGGGGDGSSFGPYLIGTNTGDTYAGTKAISIESADPTTNDPNPSMRVNGNTREGVVEIDFAAARAALGANAASLSTATLHLNKPLTGTAIIHTIYALTRTVVMNQVTWTVYSTGNNWATAGAKGTGDYNSTPLATATLSTGAGYQVFSGSGLTAAMLAAFNAGGKLWILVDGDPGDFTSTSYDKEDAASGSKPFVTIAGST